MRESRLSGSVEGVVCKHDSYSDLIGEQKLPMMGMAIRTKPRQRCPNELPEPITKLFREGQETVRARGPSEL
jgi:hypothetical protein